jgi:hypothetical protein
MCEFIESSNFVAYFRIYVLCLYDVRWRRVSMKFVRRN